MMATDTHPESEEAVAAAVRVAFEAGEPLRIIGGGTRAALGRPVQAARRLILDRLAGITLHEPAEMVIAAKAGTPLAAIEAALDAKGQMLAFEPADFRALFGSQGTPSIGAIAAGNISGPRRIWGGAARDSLIGLRFVNGRGEIVKSGGRVMKNVTGLDLVKLQAGAWGTLGILTEVTFKVVPKPETIATLALDGLDDPAAQAAMSAALASPFEITGAAHLAAGLAGETARTLLRIEGFGFSVDYRAGELARLLAPHGRLERLDNAAGRALWAAIRDGLPLAEPREAALWRLSLKPSEAAAAVAAIRARRDARAYYDWGGGLVWLATAADGDAGAGVIRAAARAAHGHATLIRAPEPVRAAVSVFEPGPAPVAAITARIRAAVDPAGLLNPGLMHAGA
ncbi:FAD-binding protein [Rhabdaerophilum calidifontis]|uniref:FAD-binding protein n=1 Tax=Rhabdaerophilum calidifontis TaxID=2604328 RepID=UPI001FEAD539|nr:FAD-binding protein [Rhabdaerophilum calidifontis]